MARRRRLERKPLLAVVITAVFFAWLYLPILAVALFSLNDKKSLSSFSGFSLRWYDDLAHNAALLDSLVASLTIASIATVGSVVLGTMLALGLERVRSRRGRVIGAITLLPLVTPEIVTGVAALLLFTGIGMKLSMTTVVLAEITFSIAYVTVIVRGRLAGIALEVEEAARDLGCTPAQAVRLVILPMLVPALLGAALLVFALVFDDFVLAFFTTGVDPQPLPVRVYSSIRFGVSPAINAIGTLMLLASALLIVAALTLPRLFGRGSSSLDLITGGHR
ncbi:spermidine/putrescine transport system permease protein/putrescine transport system permease protein [Nocardioides sp. BE266]|uniref:ABC transporter permease n=1 Tax=Nocardioides sp. BE266 TaxID=2817725 RepID=UPI0028594453|nr:ABC transporter permease [Nocardioides sp. BE266]MDR7252533.1 spermidine/putrescine transport system permease protein/putrescine transport system permease protein [Nocardioides sp. BE266]